MSAAHANENLGNFSYGQIDADILATLGKPGKTYLALLVLCFVLLLFGAVSYAYLVATGIGATGLNNPVGWGSFITNFVFWVGIGHAGTLISAVLFLLRVPWRTAIFRAAEAATRVSRRLSAVRGPESRCAPSPRPHGRSRRSSGIIRRSGWAR